MLGDTALTSETQCAVTFLYSTAPDTATAETIARLLVETGVAACVTTSFPG